MKSIGLRARSPRRCCADGEVWGALRRLRRRRGGAAARAASSGSSASAGCSRQALANADARAELAASRTRLCEAGDEARRRLERALHEGAHQHVVALALKLRVARGRAMPGLAGGGGAAPRCWPTRWRPAPRWASSRAACIPPSCPSAGSRPRCRCSRRARRCPSHLRELPGRRFAAVIETTAYLLVAEAIANAAAPRPRDRVHAARRRRRRPADGRGPRQRHRRRRAASPAAAWSASPTARRRSAARSRSTRRAAAAPRSGSRSPLSAERLALLVPRPDPLRRSGHERAPQQRRRPPVLRERARRLHARAVPGHRPDGPRRRASG